MTEAEWLVCSDPGPMLKFLRHSRPQTPPLRAARRSKRKMGLFICACYHRIWSTLGPEARKLVEDYENFSEGIETWQAVEEAYWAGIRRSEEIRQAKDRRTSTISFVSWASPRAHFNDPTELAMRLAKCAAGWENVEALAAEREVQCQYLRDIFKPFCPILLDPAWLTATVKRMTKSIYPERDFDRLPILADALEDAGCDNADMLAHCRSPGPHVRGCWVVDLILGKE